MTNSKDKGAIGNKRICKFSLDKTSYDKIQFY